MARISIRNNASCPLLGRAPGAEFKVDADSEGAPVEIYWRKRIIEGVVSIVPDQSEPAAPVARAVSPKPAKKE